VVEDVQETAPIETVAKKLLSEVVRPYSAATGEAVVTASIGISLFPRDGQDAETLLSNATAAPAAIPATTASTRSTSACSASA